MDNSIKAAFFDSKTNHIGMAVIFFCLLLTALIYPLKPAGYALVNWEEFSHSAWRAVKLPMVEMLAAQPEIMTLRTSFPASNADTLVIPRQSGNAIQVSLNGKVIYSVGDLDQPTANLWNMVHMVKLPGPLLAENQLEIRLASSAFATGLTAIPYLAPYAQAACQVTFLNWIYIDFLEMASGAALFIGVILIILAAIRAAPWSVELFMGMAMLFSVLYTQDTAFRFTTGSVTAFLWTKKVFMVSGYLGTLCFLCGLERYYWQRLLVSRWLALLTLLSVFLVFSAGDRFALSITLYYTNAILFINLAFVIGMVLRRKQSPPWMLLPATLLGLSTLQMLLAIPLHLFWPLSTAYIILIATILIGAKLIIDFNKVFSEVKILKRTKDIDPLTGVLNRGVLHNFAVSQHDYIVMIDLDQFKEINDHFGHSFGDYLLVQFTDLVRKHLRQDDLIIRYGGDEFVLILDHIPHTQAGYQEVESILQRITQQSTVLHPDINVGISYGIAVLDGSLEHSLDTADRRMYVMKETNKTEKVTRGLPGEAGA
jgi:diguanylate cyclase